ncbi:MULTISPECIES: KinB-signaling pathway activation protein [unclassified Bacillus (in: firmicutes)]|uniref:KinB-signaling pathway activation protein n=1 Tax=unclassified Bacillus (in: firmicutes) TaxID=185979 RepID=UPI0008E5CDCE|nr:MULTISPECIES: KinB-signaling pathway activation protein [unclassified Bacillus (in: firmicutes)]SFB26804.1 KinB signaling pathway activation protein [Bacillus sp. UNCCL13]SFQ92058.1 KinB signaling pathway activation protein [Bacillus sp. cl95]
MTSRNLVRLFFSTLLVGGLTTGIVGFIVRWEEFQPIFSDFDIVEILSILAWLVGIGLIFSIISQMGFFAYLTVHRFGLGIFKSLWSAVQVLLIAIVLFDLVYLRYKAFAEPGESIVSYLSIALVVMVIGVVVAYLKMKQTTKEVFIPAAFFMIVVTVIEWVPVLRVNESSWLYLMVFPLLVCNAYQLLILHKLNEQSMRERESKELQKNNKKPIEKKTKKKPAK